MESGEVQAEYILLRLKTTNQRNTAEELVIGIRVKGSDGLKGARNILVNSRGGRGEAGGRCHAPGEIRDMHQPIKDSYYTWEIHITNFHLVISKFTDRSPPFFLENLLTAAIPQNGI